MPIRQRNGKWYWGSQGPFDSRDKAEEVQRAAYANGYRGGGAKTAARGASGSAGVLGPRYGWFDLGKILDEPITMQYGGSGYSGYGSEYIGAYGAPEPEPYDIPEQSPGFYPGTHIPLTPEAAEQIPATSGEDYYHQAARLQGTDPEQERYEFLVSRLEAGTPFENMTAGAQQFLRRYNEQLKQQQRDAVVRQQAMDQAIEAVGATNPQALAAGYTPEQLADIQYRIGMEVEQGGYDPEGEYQRLRQAQAVREAQSDALAAAGGQGRPRAPADLGRAVRGLPEEGVVDPYVRTARGNYIERPEETGLTDKILAPAGKVLGGAARSALDTPLASVAAGLNPLTAPWALGAEAARRLGLVEGPGGPTVADVPPAAYEAYMYDIPVVSPFMRETVQPIAGDVGEFLAEQAIRSYLPFGLEAVSDAIGLDFVSGAGEAGETAGEALTPITAGDIAVSLLIPATADWGDIYRVAKATGMIDELGRVVGNSAAMQRLARRMGMTVDQVRPFVERLIRDESGYIDPEMLRAQLRDLDAVEELARANPDAVSPERLAEIPAERAGVEARLTQAETLTPTVYQPHRLEPGASRLDRPISFERRVAETQIPEAPGFRGEQGYVQRGLLSGDEAAATAGARGYQPGLGEVEAPPARQVDEGLEELRQGVRDVEQMPHHSRRDVFTEPEGAAVDAYVRGGYRDINANLRAGNIPEQATAIDAALQKSSLPKDMTLYRGMPVPENVKVGDELVDDGYLSASLRPGRAQDFVSAEGKRLVAIEAPAGTPGLRGAQLSNEVILPRGSRLRVTGIDEDGTIRATLETTTARTGEVTPSGQTRLLEQQGEYAARVPETPANTVAGEPNVVNLPRQRVTIQSSDITTRPDVFQARDADPGSAVSQQRVKQLVQGFDEAQFTPPSVVRDPDNPGKYIVYRGHHRAEAWKAVKGPDAPIEVQLVDADINNPEQLKALILEGDASNFKTALPNFRESVRAVTRAEAAGLDDVQIADRLRKSTGEIQQLRDAGRLGEQVLDRVVAEPSLGPVASELGRGMRVYGISPEDAQAWFGRLARATKGERPTVSALRETVDKFGKQIADLPQGALFETGGFEGTRGGLLGVLDENAKLRASLESEMRKMKRLQKQLNELSDSPTASSADKRAASRLVERAKKEQRRLQQEIRRNSEDVVAAFRQQRQASPTSSSSVGVSARASKDSETLGRGPSLDQPSGRQTSTTAESPSATTRKTTPSLSKGGVGTKDSVIAPPSNPILHEITDPDTLLRLGQEKKPVLDEGLDQLFGPSFVASRAKGRDRFGEKLAKAAAEGRGPEQISDYLGARVVASDPSEGVSRLSSRWRIIDDTPVDTAAGYRARHVQVDVGDGFSAEVQVLNPRVAPVQEYAHHYYEMLRAPEADLETVNRAAAASKYIYDNAPEFAADEAAAIARRAIETRGDPMQAPAQLRELLDNAERVLRGEQPTFARQSLFEAAPTPGAGRAVSDLAPPPSATAPPATTTTTTQRSAVEGPLEMRRSAVEPPPPEAPTPAAAGGPPSEPPLPPDLPPERLEDFGEIIEPPPRPGGIEAARQIAEAKIPKAMSVEAGERPSVIRRAVGQVIPGVKYPRPVLVANSASDAVHAQVATWVDPQLDAARAVQEAFDAAPPVYRGAATTADVGTPAHFLEQPWEYDEVSDALVNARRQWDEAFDGGLRRAADEYGVQIDPFYPRGPNGERGSYVPHMESQAAIDARKAAGEVGPEPSLRSTARVSIEKERGVPTLTERLTYDPTFQPELDLPTLASRHAAQLNDAAARKTYATLVEGKTGTQIMEEAHPELLRLRKDLTNRVHNARESLRNVERLANIGERRVGTLDTRIRNLQSKIDSMASRVEGLGDEYGPELSFLSGELRQMSQQLRALGDIRGGELDKVINNLERANDMFTEYAAKMTDLDDLRRVVRTTNTKRVVDESGKVTHYVFDRVTNKWVLPDVARASEAISRTKTSGLTQVLEEARAVQLNAGDLSPLTFGRAQMGMAGYLGTGPQSIPSVARAIISGDEFWRGVDPDMLEAFQGLRGVSVTRPLAEIRPTQARRGLERLPGVGGAIRAANDAMNRMATAGEFMAWETATRSILRRKPELSLAEAGAEAMKAMDSIAPRIDLTKYGFSKAGARQLNAPMTSVSYMMSLPNFAANFSGAGAKLMANLGTHYGNPLAAWRALGAADQETLIHGIELIGTMTAISGATAALFDDRAGYTLEEKVKQAIDPLDPNFWKIHLPGGYSIPIAAPMRSGIRAAVRTVTGDPTTPIDYAANRLISIPRFMYSMVFNRDWTDDKIVTEDDLLGKARQIILYGLETANITASPAFRALRTGSASFPGQGGSLKDIALEMGVSQLGFNIYEPSVWRQRDDQVMSDIETGATYTDAYGNEKPYPKTYVDAEGNEQPVRSYRDLRAASPLAADDFDARHGDLAAAADELRSETSQRIRTLQEEFRGRQEARDARLLDEDPAEWREQSSEDASRTSAAIEERALDFGGELDVETRLDEILDDYGAAIEEATTDTGAVDWLAVDRYVAQLSEEERTLLLEARMRGETEARKQYYRDLEQHMVPYFEVRDKEWAKLQRQNPERFGDYASADQFRIAERKRLEAQGMPPLIAEDLANTIVETATAGADVESTVYLLQHPEVIAVLEKYGFYVPADLKPLSPNFSEQLQPTR